MESVDFISISDLKTIKARKSLKKWLSYNPKEDYFTDDGGPIILGEDFDKYKKDGGFYSTTTPYMELTFKDGERMKVNFDSDSALEKAIDRICGERGDLLEIPIG